MKSILGRKVEMTQYFDEDGKVSPATVISSGPVTVTQVKTADVDGYEAVQIGFGTRNPKNISKPVQGHTKDLGSFEVLREFAPNGEEVKKGDVFQLADVLAAGDTIYLTGTSKGKGFQGVVKRHGFAGGRRSHGQKHSEREPGSIGSTGPQRVFKGTRMAGRMGHDRVSLREVKVIAVDTENNLVTVKGQVPGRRGTLIEMTKQN